MDLMDACKIEKEIKTFEDYIRTRAPHGLFIDTLSIDSNLLKAELIEYLWHTYHEDILRIVTKIYPKTIDFITNIIEGGDIRNVFEYRKVMVSEAIYSVIDNSNTEQLIQE
jgi:hypothetical protein